MELISNSQLRLRLANYGYVMENGRIVLDGPAEKLEENEDIKEFYLGLSQKGKRKSYREVSSTRRNKMVLGDSCNSSSGTLAPK